MLRRSFLAALVLALPSALPTPAVAQDRGVVNVYSARHYDSDRQIWEAFTRESGIRVRVIQADADQLIERIRNEGANSPADVFLTVDSARLARAADAGILAPFRSPTVENRVPAALRDPQGRWFAVSQRARVIMYDKQAGRPEGLNRYEDLADPRFRGQICVRSGAHSYNTSMTASILAADGAAATENWARGLVANLARPPQGGDRDQIAALPTGQCRIAISNTYYLGGYGRSANPAERALFERVGVIFPNQGQGDRGAHVNISGAGLVGTAPNRDNAAKLLEFLTGHEAQDVFSQANMEYPAVADAPLHPALRSMGTFRAEPVNGARTAANTAEALQIAQRAGWR
ncbi:extracellular solute-binding protein [Roseomonas sp. BN140053]|uniref:extracellular solute-binding protein n=1 Tax=Roseomonas sp. BN140053 TaxID=3391898 RepID=UPI0039EC0EDF